MPAVRPLEPRAELARDASLPDACGDLDRAFAPLSVARAASISPYRPSARRDRDDGVTDASASTASARSRRFDLANLLYLTRR